MLVGQHPVVVIKKGIHIVILVRVVRMRQVLLVLVEHPVQFQNHVVAVRPRGVVINVILVPQLINTVVAGPDIVEEAVLLVEENIRLVHVVAGIHGAEAVVQKIVLPVLLTIVMFIVVVMVTVVPMVLFNLVIRNVAVVVVVQTVLVAVLPVARLLVCVTVLLAEQMRLVRIGMDYVIVITVM